jgi:xylose isomerase
MLQLRLMGSLTSLTLCGVALVAQTSALDAQKPSETPKKVHQIFVEDQDDSHGPNGPRFSEEEYHRRVKVREITLREMLASGEMKTGDDFTDAATIFQHGNTAEDCLFAHILAMEAMARGTAAARWIAAATLDRYLQLTKQPQVWATTMSSPFGNPSSLATLKGTFTRRANPANIATNTSSIKNTGCTA